MSDQWPEPTCIDGDLDVAAACGLPEFSSPISATTAEYLFTQDWMVSRKAFQRTPLNTPHPSQSQVPDYSAYRLVEEGPRTDVGGGMVKWKRTYAIVPESHDEFESYSQQFPGLPATVQTTNLLGGGTTTVTIPGRASHSGIVSSRVRHDYFLVGVGGAYATAGDIAILQPSQIDPVFNAFRFVAETSRLSRWRGNIYLRATRYVAS